MKLETFFEKFDRFAEAADAVEKMRELVLQLAVQGRLVQQDRTEESAPVLLKRIRATRATLPANRCSGEEMDTVQLEEEASPFAAPPGWTWTTLGNVQVFTNGYAFKSEDYQSSGVGIIRMGELGANGEIDERNMKYVTNDIAQSLPDTFRVRPGDLLMGMSGSIGKLAINRSDKVYLLNQRVGRLEPILIEKAFLHVFLKTVEQHYLRISFGMAIKNLSTKQINETPFPLPPLAEQKRIVAKVEELMALCDRLEAEQQERETRHAALARASLARFADAPTPANLSYLFYPSYTINPADLRKSILTLAIQGKLVPQDPAEEPAEAILRETQLLFDRLVAAKQLSSPKSLAPIEETETPFRLPNGWAWCRLGQLMRISSGDGLIAKDMRDGPIPVYGGNGVTGYHDASNVFKKTLVIGRVGFYCGSIHVTPTKAWVTDNAFVTTFAEEHVAIEFLQWLLKATDLRVRDNSTAQPVISGGKIYPTILAIPPLAEQRRIVAKVDQLMKLVDQLETDLAASRTVASSLLEAVVAELTAVA